MDERLMTAKEVGEYLGVKPKTVLTWASQGKIPCLRFNRQMVRFDLDRVLKALRDWADREEN